jgi:hypothetical protein
LLVGKGTKECSGHGLCHSDTATCDCENDWIGQGCSISKCTNGRGTWNTDNQKEIPFGSCKCETRKTLLRQGGQMKIESPAYWGDYCEYDSCPGYVLSSKKINEFSFCSNHGSCNGTTSLCSCSSGFTGRACATPISLVTSDTVNNELRKRAEEEADALMMNEPLNPIVIGKESITWSILVNTMCNTNVTNEIMNNVREGTLKYMKWKEKDFISFTIETKQHVDSYVNKLNNTKIFEAETIMEMNVLFHTNELKERNLINSLTLLDSTTISSNKERDDYKRSIISFVGSNGYKTTNIQIARMPSIERIEKNRNEVISDILKSKRQ